MRLQFIEPGKPIQNAFIESFNSWLREEWLNEHVFVPLDDARRKIEQWRVQYRREHPHSSLGYLTPEEFVARNQGSSAIARTAWPAKEMLAGRFEVFRSYTDTVRTQNENRRSIGSTVMEIA